MTIELKDIMQALLSRSGGWLYNSALTKLVYLVDVESVRRHGEQLSGISWKRDNFGPFVWDVIDCAKENPDFFEIVNEGGDRRRIHLRSMCEVALSESAEGLIKDVLTKTPDPKHNFNAFKAYVYRTAPMIVSSDNGPLNLAEAVQEAGKVDELVNSIVGNPEWSEAFRYLAAN
jgi:hypothetical protein